MTEGRQTHQHSDSDGHFRRKESVFRDFISSEPDAKFPAEKGRYCLYLNVGCPWAHRTIIVRALKSLEPVIQMITTDFDLTQDGWVFTGRNGSDGADPLYGFTALKQLYMKADPSYNGRYTVPCLWDKKLETIVNNESSEIIRMLYSSFDDFLEPHMREPNRPGGGFYPANLRSQIDEMNEWVYNTVNNGVYKVGFASTQDAYDAAIYPLFKSLDRLEAHLSEPSHQPYLFGPNITEADIRLYTTMIRFDVAYHSIFLCNLKMIRHDYPRLSRWLRNLYWDESDRTNGGAFKKTTFFDVYKYGYLKAKGRQTHGGSDLGWPVVIPRGPVPDIEPLTDEEEQEAMKTTSTATTHSNGTNETSEARRKLSELSTTDSSRPPVSHNPFSAISSNAGMGAMFAAEEDSTTPASATGLGTGTGKNEEADEDDEEDGELNPAKIKKRTTYKDENEKWVKAAKKAEKKAGAPSVHLAL